MTRPPRTPFRSLLILIATAALGGASCGESGEPSDAQKEAAKRARDKELIKLPYPAPSGARPATMEVTYDGARDRTTVTLRLTGLPLTGSGAPGVAGATLFLTSSHPGAERPPGNPEGSVDGSLVVRSQSPGVLAFAGVPASVVIDGVTTPLREAAGGADDHYTSTKTATGYEEVVRFRFPTEQVVAAANSGGFTLAFARLDIRITGQHLADFREFTATLNPNR